VVPLFDLIHALRKMSAIATMLNVHGTHNTLSWNT
jgi:hypothetical protein